MNKDDQAAFRQAVKDKELDMKSKSSGPSLKVLIISFCCVAVVGLAIVAWETPNLFTESTIDRIARENPERMKQVSEELWGKPDENITKLPQLD